MDPSPTSPSSGQKSATIFGVLLSKPNRKGFQAPEIKKKLSLRASVTSDLIMDDVEFPMKTSFPKLRACALR